MNIPERYVKKFVSNVEKYLDDLADARWKFLKKKAEKPFVVDHALETDENPALEQYV